MQFRLVDFDRQLNSNAIDKDFVLKFAEAPRAWIAIKYNFDDIQKTTCVNINHYV